MNRLRIIILGNRLDISSSTNQRQCLPTRMYSEVGVRFYLEAVSKNKAKRINIILESLVLSGGIFAFFLVSGISIGISLCFIHSRALGRKQVKYLVPYVATKLFRMLALGTFSIVILISPRLITTYFYASIYGLFECVAGSIALEVKIFNL
ncbi:hypothetical protein ANCCAN_04525 [Ancylostoma caninum]|uniref:Uncharacterized protein n=1 Tax=Ancylostoma caninum TaxID=29170 RepID=A0A368H2E3_ANCCA|nr:hypothetical protein ANCCAN_04525 [Ancylostoma caninum]